MVPTYDYESCVKNSERVAWKLDDVLPSDGRLDFSRPFLPEALVRTRDLGFLDPDQRLTLNHIMGNAYLNLFAFVEEYIIAMATQHAHAELFGDDSALRALLRFSDEELKHQQLFQRYRAAFEQDFGATNVLKNAVEVAGLILSKSPIAVVLTTLQFELVTQHHYVSSVKDDASIDPLFASLLKYHWMEEAQHAKIDILELERMILAATSDEVTLAFDDYMDICTSLSALLWQQAQMDAHSLGLRIGSWKTAEPPDPLIEHIAKAYRHMFLRSGMEHPQFCAVVASISRDAAQRVLERGATL